MKRFLPRSLTAQLLLLLALALVIASAVTLALLGSERRLALRDAQRLAELERVAALVPGLTELDGAGRQRIARASSRRGVRLRVDPRPIVRRRRRMPALEARFAEAAGVQHDAVRIAVSRRPRDVRVSVRLPDGEWLNARLDGGAPPGRAAGAAVLIALALSLVLVLGGAWWFLQRIVRPIRALADAAERAGAGDRTAMAPVEGSAETRAAAEAFNAMQGSIARFEAERARTVAALGHDLRTPITSLRIRAEMLDEDAAAPMVRTLDEMRVMADGLLAWGSGRAEEMRSVDLGALLASVCADVDGVDYEGPGSFEVRGQPVALRRAFANLVGNAAVHGNGGRVRVVDRAVVIEDDGPGIVPERMADMLEPFRRGEASRSRDTGGAGLGLSIARDVVRAHGWQLELEARKPQGLRVRVVLETE